MLKYLILLILSVTHANDINVNAKVTRSHVGIEDRVFYEINIQHEDNNIDIKEPLVASVDGLTLENRQTSSGSHTTIINGVFSSRKTQTLTYIFRADKEGTFTIPSHKILINNQPFFTEKIEIQVSKNQKRGRGLNQLFFQDFFTNDLFDVFRQNKISEDDIFIKVQVDKTNAYLGERVQVSWHLYTTRNILNIAHLKHPTLEGFWKEDIDIPTQLTYQSEIINNKNYNKALLFKFDLFPLKTGELYIDEYRARYKLMLENEYIRESDKIKINVLPLPEEGKPVGFNNAVGEYNIHLKRISSQIKTNTPFNYTVVINGYGNINKLTLPDISFQPLKIYDVVEKSNYETKPPNHGKGFKEFDHLLIAQNRGKYVLPEIQFSFFNPKQKKYITQTIPPLELTAVGDNFIPTLKEDTTLPEDELPYFETSISTNWFESKYVTIFLALFLFSFVLTKAFSLPKNATSITMFDKIKTLHNIKEPDKLSVLALDIISHLLREITGSNNPINSELVELIPISKKNLKPKFKELICYFEKLAFFTNTDLDSKELKKNINLLIALSKLI